VARWLVTAGPTREPIDAVRYLSNRSSGRFGFAIASAAAARGHDVCLIHGPVALRPPARVSEVVAIETAAELHRETTRRWRDADVAVMVAAVADYTVARPSKGKLRRKGEGLHLDLVATRDVAAALGRRRRAGQLLVGFALEASDPGHRSARRKLAAKGCNLIVANSPETLDSTAVALVVLDGTGEVVRHEGSKRAVAGRLVRLFEDRLAALQEESP
jgi:phosphopantothenoylcysteine decarboxylase/phosphopantothenate--cysteine ligase